MEHAFAADCALTYRGSFAVTSPRNVQRFAAPCKSSWVITAYTDDRYFRVRSASLASRSGRRNFGLSVYRHPASVPYASFWLRARNDARFTTPVSAPSLRCGLPFRKASLRFPTLGRCAPANAASAWTAARLAFHGRVRGASCHRLSFMRRHPWSPLAQYSIRWRASGRNCDDILSSLRSPKFTSRSYEWSASRPKELWRASCPPTKKATLAVAS